MEEKNTKNIIALQKSIIPALDVDDLKKAEDLVKKTTKVAAVGAYKIGFSLALKHGLPEVVRKLRGATDKPLIYDHQKAGTDVPHTGELFARACKQAGVDAVILFPLSGPETERAWIRACKKSGLGVIVGGHMTHPSFLDMDGGYIVDEGPRHIYELAVSEGVRDFVVPATDPDVIHDYKQGIESEGCHQPVFYSPGLITQGGDITEAARAAGERWHAIVGRAIYEARDPRAAAEKLCAKL